MTEHVQRIAWAGKLRSIDTLAAHFALCGGTGSGKTLLLRTMMQTALVEDGRLLHRSLIFDPKLEFYPILRGMGVPAASIKVMNPFDQRCTPWNLAADVTSDATAQALALTLIPERSRTNPFFETAARQLLVAAMIALNSKHPGDWTLKTLIELCLDEFALKDALTNGPHRTSTAPVAEHLLNDENKSAGEIFSSFYAEVATYRPVADAWSLATEPALSLSNWVGSSEPSVLLLASDDANAASLDPINRAIFSRTAELITGRITPPTNETVPDRTWIFLDELRLLGKLPNLDRLLLKGRSKGAHMVLAFQDILGLRHVYGELVADEMIGQCHNIGLLRIVNPATRKWASAMIGEQSMPNDTRSIDQKSNFSKSTTMQDRPIVSPTAFLVLPRPEKGHGVPGLFLGYGGISAWIPHDIDEYAPGAATLGALPDDFIGSHLAEPSNKPLDAGVIRLAALDSANQSTQSQTLRHLEE